MIYGSPLQNEIITDSLMQLTWTVKLSKERLLWQRVERSRSTAVSCVNCPATRDRVMSTSRLISTTRCHAAVSSSCGPAAVATLTDSRHSATVNSAVFTWRLSLRQRRHLLSYPHFFTEVRLLSAGEVCVGLQAELPNARALAFLPAWAKNVFFSINLKIQWGIVSAENVTSKPENKTKLCSHSLVTFATICLSVLAG